MKKLANTQSIKQHNLLFYLYLILVIDTSDWIKDPVDTSWIHLDMVGVGGSSPLGRTISSKSISYKLPRLKMLTTYFGGHKIFLFRHNPHI